jgi:hypothetical protein
MKTSKIIFALIAAIVAAAGVSASDMTLTHTGDLYRVVGTEDGLMVSLSPADGSEMVEYPIPQTTGVIASYLNIAIDQTSRNLYVVWQQGVAPAAELKIASLIDDTWDGPVTLAGGDGTNAVFPELLLDKRTFARTIGEGEGAETITEEMTFLHLVWWSYYKEVADGAANLATLSVEFGGMPNFDDFSPIQLSGLLPFGIGCAGIADAPNLAQPKIWIDPKSGKPIVMATDFDQCLFELLELDFSDKEVDEFQPIAKRRRRVVIFGRSRMVPFSQMPPLALVKVDPVRDMGVTLYWHKDNGIEFLTLEENGWSDLRGLAVGDDLSQTEAVELVRTLAR